MDTGRTGWLSPTAEFVECEVWEHDEKAATIVVKLGLYDANKGGIPDEILIESGWIRVSMLTFVDFGLMFRYPFRGFITEDQKRYLRGVFEKDRGIISKDGFRGLYEMGVIDKEELKTFT